MKNSEKEVQEPEKEVQKQQVQKQQVQKQQVQERQVQKQQVQERQVQKQQVQERQVQKQQVQKQQVQEQQVQKQKVQEKQVQKQKVQEQVRQLLQQNSSLDVETTKRRVLLQLNQDVEKMDYCNPQPFAEKILVQVSYFSPWIWPVQAGLLAMPFYYSYLERSDYMAMFILLLAPCLTLILLWELSRIFGHNMWEMESACRYNLPQLFLFRLCILSGSDFLVLGSVLTVFCRTGGLLWQFALNVLLPFFLMTSLCLWALRRFGSRVNVVGLAAVNLMLFSLWTSRVMDMTLTIYGPDFPSASKINLESLPGIVLWVTLFALALFFINAYRLCTKQYYEINRKDHSIWNLE